MATQSTEHLTNSLHKCSDCQNYALHPSIGHFKCAKHRSCSGTQGWQPHNCEICLLYKYNTSKLSNVDKTSSLDELSTMLQEMSDKLSNNEMTWVYVNTFYSFMDVQRPEAFPSQSETPEIEDGEIPNESEIPETGHSSKVSDEQIDNSNTLTENSPSGNEMLQTVMMGLQNLTECIQLKFNLNSKGGKKPIKRSRKRQRTPSPIASDDHSDYEDSEYSSDMDQGSEPSRSPSPPIPQVRTKRRRGKEYFTEGSTVYFFTDDRRVVENKVWFDGELREVKWHHTENAFSLIKTSNIKSPFMSATQAHEALVSCFNTLQDTSERPGLDRKSYRVHLEKDSGLAQALNLIKQETPNALHLLYTEEKDKYWKTFTNPAFKSTTMVNFSSGWNLTDHSYLEWAKHEKLKAAQFSQEVLLPFTPSIPNKFLETECAYRAQLVDSISGLSMLDSLAKKVKHDVSTHSAVESIARHYLSLLSDTTLRWISAKIDIRKIVLQGSSTPQAADLLGSDVWEPTIFGQKAVTKLIEGDVPRIGIDKRLKINPATSRYYHKFPKKVFPSRLGNKPKFFQGGKQRHSPIRYEETDPYTAAGSSKNQQFKNNFHNSTQGAQQQRGGWRLGTSNQKQNRGASNRGKGGKQPWNKNKQNKNGSSGFTGSPKGNNNAQQ